MSEIIKKFKIGLSENDKVEIKNSIINYLENSGVKASGVFKTLDELKETYPSGNENYYVVAEDNNWYMWDSSEQDWVVGNIFGGKPGVGISSIEKTSSVGFTDIYQITFSDGSTTNFAIRNGEPGSKGPQGVKGERGDPGGFIHIAGIIASVDLLPKPTELQDLTIAFLVGDAEPYDLYMQIGTAEDYSKVVWQNLGALNLATYVTVNGQYQGTWNADTKKDAFTFTDSEEIVWDTSDASKPKAMLQNDVTNKIKKAFVRPEASTTAKRVVAIEGGTTDQTLLTATHQNQVSTVMMRDGNGYCQLGAPSSSNVDNGSYANNIANFGTLRDYVALKLGTPQYLHVVKNVSRASNKISYRAVFIDNNALDLTLDQVGQYMADKAYISLTTFPYIEDNVICNYDIINVTYEYQDMRTTYLKIEQDQSTNSTTISHVSSIFKIESQQTFKL